MGFLSRLFGRVQEEPLAPPESPPARPEPPPRTESPPAEPEAVEPEPAAPLAPEPEPAEPKPAAEPEPEHAAEEEPEPAPSAPPPSAAATPASRPGPSLPELTPKPEPEPPPASLALTLEEARAALRAAGSDGIRIGFLARDYQRAAEEDRNPARRRLVSVLTEQLRARGLLSSDGRFELREAAEYVDAPRA